MKKGRDMVDRIRINKIIFIIPLFFFAITGLQLTKLTLSTKIDGINLKDFANNRNTKKETLYATRGTIYTYNGEILAQNIDSYTVIAYLSAKRSEDSKKTRHVVDKQMTAEKLSPILNMSVEDLLKLLNKENLYQVELRPGGRGITELKKEEIEKLQLPGIDFIQTFKRYYPNNDFLSYTLGYATMKDEDLKIIGHMGIEKYFDKELSGEDGYLEYQKDLNGYKIPNTPERKKNEKDGMDIYLTIDDNIQMFTERVVKETYETYNPEWMLMVVADAKTGAILGTTSSPSFNPNIKDIQSYLNPLVAYAYEPGSTMKTFTYMTAIEKGTYNGNETFKSGKITVTDHEIFDWNGKGWGTISYDQGYTLSSNVGAANIMNNFLTRKDLKDYLDKLGFGKKTNITLPGELAGKVDFKYEVEVANAAFGQGFTITPIQMIQALTSITNNGVLLKPYIVDKIVDPSTKEIVYKGKREELGVVASETTINQMKDLMYKVINGDSTNCTGYPYKISGYDIMGKTGTAQYVDSKTGKYANGTNEYIKSFTGIFPKDDPRVIIYVVIKKPSHGDSSSLYSSSKKLMNDLAKYLNIKQNNGVQDNNNSTFVVPNYLNQDPNLLSSSSHTSNIIIGSGSKIINQYPKEGTIINDKDKIFIVTNDKNIKLVNMLGWSSREIETYCSLLEIKCNIQGYGFVTNQSVPVDTLINDTTEVILTLTRMNPKVEIGT